MKQTTSSTASNVLADAEILYSITEITDALQKMASSISQDLMHEDPLALVCMVGGLVPAGWLLPLLQFPMQLDYIQLTRYRGELKGGEPQWLKRPLLPMRDRTILIIDDIFDEGLTLETIHDYCFEQGAKKIKTAVLINKQAPRKSREIEIDYVGLTVPNRYVFGFGMDYQHYWRNAPGIYAVKDS